MFEVSALCTSHRCGRHEFVKRRRSVLKTSTSGQLYEISQVVCPQCGMWAEIMGIKEVK